VKQPPVLLACFSRRSSEALPAFGSLSLSGEIIAGLVERSQYLRWENSPFRQKSSIVCPVGDETNDALLGSWLFHLGFGCNDMSLPDEVPDGSHQTAGDKDEEPYELVRVTFKVPGVAHEQIDYPDQPKDESREER
jgi:hypothetical protein